MRRLGSGNPPEIDCLYPDDWIVGGRRCPPKGRSIFYFDIEVVDETNTKSEKAQYIGESSSRSANFSVKCTLKAIFVSRTCGPPPMGSGERPKSFGFTMSPDGSETRGKLHRPGRTGELRARMADMPA
jgi:hypothetical protein